MSMGKTSKAFALILTILIVMSCLTILTVKPANAQSIPKPSVPEFTLNIVDGSLLIEIQNQPIIPNGHDTAGIFYDFRYKWHESTNWYHPEPDPTKWRRQYIAEIGTTGITRLADPPNKFYIILGDSNSHELDYQIRAINGYQNTTYPWVPPIGIESGDNPVIIVNTSEWSETVTITLPDYKPETSTTTPKTTINPTTIPSGEPTASYNPNTKTASPICSNDFIVLVTIALSIISAVLIVLVLFLILIYRKFEKAIK
jgi:hypothetical protein